MAAFAFFYLGFLPGIARADERPCTVPFHLDDVTRTIEEADRAYTDLDEAGFKFAANRLAAGLPCLDVLLPEDVVAAVHRTQGLLAFVQRDTVRAQQAFLSARTLEPEWRFPVAMVPPQHSLLRDYDALVPEGGMSVRVPAPSVGEVAFDGHIGLVRPADRPTLVEIFDGAGVVTASAYVWPEGEIPAYAHADGPSISILPPPPKELRPQVPWLVGASGAVIVSAGLYLGANQVADRFWDPSANHDDLDGLRKSTNTLVVASAVFGAAAIGGGIGAVVVGEW